MERVKLEVRERREYEVMFCDAELTPGEERVLLRASGPLELGDDLVVPGQDARFRVSGYYFSNPPPPSGMRSCIVETVSGDMPLREGMILVPVDEA